jgi:hypothetical protein
VSNVHGREALVGAWQLPSWENRAADGQVTYPMGTDGCFSVTISRRGRAGFTAGDLLGGTTEEQARAVEGCVAYAGRYSFHGDRVIHHVELSLFPNWSGATSSGRSNSAGIG